jgi:hypothetical protein
MESRLVCQRPRPEVHLDIDALAREHVERMHHLADVLVGVAQRNLPNNAVWKVARAAIDRLDRELT